MPKPKVIVILGQTATGKSDLAVKIAILLRQGFAGQGKNGGEIISADSRQVYKGLDIGTGKITKREMKGVPHHLLDIANPKIKFSVAVYKKLVDQKIKQIIARGKVPIIVGGTGFYIDAVTKGMILPSVPPNPKLRRALAKKVTIELLKKLQKLDPKRAASIDQNNKVRIIRAIEVALAIGKVPKLKVKKPDYDFIKVGLTLPLPTLQEKINKRLLARIKKGMVNEAKKLLGGGLSKKRMLELGLEYRYLALYLDNKISKEEMIEKLKTQITNYAKRQMTWFKRDQEIKWFDPKEYRRIEKYILPKIKP